MTAATAIRRQRETHPLPPLSVIPILRSQSAELAELVAHESVRRDSHYLASCAILLQEATQLLNRANNDAVAWIREQAA